jgi:hypothetical protein
VRRERGKSSFSMYEPVALRSDVLMGSPLHVLVLRGFSSDVRILCIQCSPRVFGLLHLLTFSFYSRLFSEKSIERDDRIRFKSSSYKY